MERGDCEDSDDGEGDDYRNGEERVCLAGFCESGEVD